MNKGYLMLIVGLFIGNITLNAQGFVNGSFESWGLSNTCEINLAPDNWGNYSTGCIAFDEANQLLCTSTIPGAASNGNIYARACAGPDWQGGEGVFQLVSNLNPGQQYTFSFDYAGSNLYGGSDSVTWRVFIDDTLVTQTPYFSSSQSTWSTFTYSFTATQTTHKIGFRSYFIYPCVTCAGSSGIDNVKFNEMPTGNLNVQQQSSYTFYPLPCSDKLNIEGNFGYPVELTMYNLNGQVVLKNTFTRNTQIQTNTLLPGVYLGIIRKNGEVVFKQSLLKE